MLDAVTKLCQGGYGNLKVFTAEKRKTSLEGCVGVCWWGCCREASRQLVEVNVKERKAW